MKKIIGVLSSVVLLWSLAGAAVADNCTNPPEGIRISRAGPGGGTGGSDTFVHVSPQGGPWGVVQKNIANNLQWAPAWVWDCPVPSGNTGQVLKFQMISDNYWSSGIANHIPVFGLAYFDFGWPWGFKGAGLALFPVSPSGYSGVNFEDWQYQSFNAVSPAASSFQFQDGVWYNVQINVNTTATAVWIWDSAMNLLVHNVTPALTSRSLQGGYGFTVLCQDAPNRSGNNCEIDSGPFLNTAFNVYFLNIQLLFTP